MLKSCINKLAIMVVLSLSLSACGTSNKKPKPQARTHAAQMIQISSTNRSQASQELMIQSMSLIGTPYRFGGNDRTGFDCSGMIKHVYAQALSVSLPRTASDMAASSRPISNKDIQVGDLVFFNTSGSPYSHVGLYIGEGEFIHAPSSNGQIRTARLDNPYFKQRFVGARTFFKK